MQGYIKLKSSINVIKKAMIVVKKTQNTRWHSKKKFQIKF